MIRHIFIFFALTASLGIYGSMQKIDSVMQVYDAYRKGTLEALARSLTPKQKLIFAQRIRKSILGRAEIALDFSHDCTIPEEILDENIVTLNFLISISGNVDACYLLPKFMVLKQEVLRRRALLYKAMMAKMAAKQRLLEKPGRSKL